MGGFLSHVGWNGDDALFGGFAEAQLTSGGSFTDGIDLQTRPNIVTLQIAALRDAFTESCFSLSVAEILLKLPRGKRVIAVRVACGDFANTVLEPSRLCVPN